MAKSGFRNASACPGNPGGFTPPERIGIELAAFKCAAPVKRLAQFHRIADDNDGRWRQTGLYQIGFRLAERRLEQYEKALEAKYAKAIEALGASEQVAQWRKETR